MSTQEIIWLENSTDSECDFEDIDINFNLTTYYGQCNSCY